MTYQTRAAALLLLPLLTGGSGWAKPVALPGGISSSGRILLVAACVRGNLAPDCQSLVKRAPPNGSPTGVMGKAGLEANRPRAAQPANHAQERALQQAAMGDLFGGRPIPPNILKILADPRIEPVTAYIVWQAARRPIEEWTVRQLQDIMAIVPTLVETGMPMPQIQALYQYLGLDPSDVFNPNLGQDWQDQSTRFDKTGSAAVAAISSSDCQTDSGQMTVATFQSCVSGGQ